jgi:hypothetical protein
MELASTVALNIKGVAGGMLAEAVQNTAWAATALARVPTIATPAWTQATPPPLG